jgi:hypothetical protein
MLILTTHLWLVIIEFVRVITEAAGIAVGTLIFFFLLLELDLIVSTPFCPRSIPSSIRVAHDLSPRDDVAASRTGGGNREEHVA